MTAHQVRLTWRSAELDSVEEFELSPTRAGHRLTGTVRLPYEGKPATIRYHVNVDDQWRTTFVDVHLQTEDDQRHLMLESDDAGHWAKDGRYADRLQGTLDIDLGWTPATNTLPIRRLGLSVGESAQVKAAWVRWPEWTLGPLDQTYERLDEKLWRYSSKNFTADLVVDDDGVVRQYGDIWLAD